MKISIVTISFNQAEFVERAIQSVIGQDYDDLEYIVVDAGSTDGSREIIEQYRDQISKILFDPDEGPADGLNKGFSHATGDVFGYINADDMLMPGAISSVAAFLEDNTDIGVVCGHASVIDENNRALRILYSDKFSLQRYVYRASVIAQQASFFRADLFHNVGGFNPENRTAWDGELFVDMKMDGAKFVVIDRILAAFRLHPNSITVKQNAGKISSEFSRSMFVKVMRREPCAGDRILLLPFRLLRYAQNPKAFLESLRRGGMRSLIKSKNI